MIFGILNITEDSFSDGGKFLASEAALTQARALARHAGVVDIGAAASNPDAKPVSPETEIARLAPVAAALKQEGVPVSIDSYAPEVQRWALAQDVDYLNDIQGFADAALYPDLARASAKLIVMHAVQGGGRATRVEAPPSEIVERVRRFFAARIAALTAAGVARERLILDPGMGFFLGADPRTSLVILRAIGSLKSEFGLPVLVSVSRKSFIRALAAVAADAAGPASLAAELFALHQGADHIRTHDPKGLAEASTVWKALAGDPARG
ncbi:MAG TPA: dihydropteroate synthase [Rhizomicrobium sp.]|jgi:dihydropteroate synthase type 2